ncbi:nitrogen fixation protein NifHD [Peptococcaceae bacterium SCADC1_2_3]|jgi:nitrogen regulatory protein PII 2|nr:nitrogen fixation protein NifHD [Peptococcaceae bacterium SCADC1_2_3]KFI37820.1 nitrogen fixation protein NifHD [Peptococcaceae bacterium SCADC1_2_3]
MKEVLAVIQMNKMECTKDALALIGFPSFTAYKAYGRGKQRGLSVAYPSEFKEEEEIKEKRMKYLPKRMISVVVEDEFIPAVVALLMKVNRTGNIGDGRIFICPVEDARRIRTGEHGKEAIS